MRALLLPLVAGYKTAVARSGCITRQSCDVTHHAPSSDFEAPLFCRVREQVGEWLQALLDEWLAIAERAGEEEA